MDRSIYFVFVGVLFYFIRFSYAGHCQTYYQCTRITYNSEKYHEACKFMKWERCTKYRQKQSTSYRTCSRSFCCPGYTGLSCSQDTNECLVRNGGCDHQCINTKGSFNCRCKDGFSLGKDRKSCVDNNECLRHNGGCDHVCVNLQGTFKCQCQKGFTLQKDGKTCIERSRLIPNIKKDRAVSFLRHKRSVAEECREGCYIEELLETFHNYQDSYSYMIRYKCEHTMSCTDGCTNTNSDYSHIDKLAVRCIDNNECLTHNGGCDQVCVNLPGTFKCLCQIGFTLQKDGKTCIDNNECLTHNGGCDHVCVNLPGTFKCRCQIGFTLQKDGKTCIDNNECLTHNGGCDHVCVNLPGTFKCQCQIGFTLQKDGKTCIDTNECLDTNGGCQQKCVNEYSSYRCECNQGYKLGGDGKSCLDIDECLGTHRCSGTCNNTVGSFYCGCLQGFKLGKDGTTCEDIDDCKGVFCLNGGSCVDAPGSYSCTCPSGFKGHLCQNDIDECSYINGGCEDICVNTNGSNYCKCQSGRTLANDNKSCIGNATDHKVSVYKKFKIPSHILPRGCAFIELLSCTGFSSMNTIKMSSTSDWLIPKSNGNIVYTLGVVFLETNEVSLPISISGMQVIRTNNKFELNAGSVKYTNVELSPQQQHHNDSCYSFTTTPKDIHEFISTFLPTVLISLHKILPDWIRFSTSRTQLFSLSDLKAEVMDGHMVNAFAECRGAPVHANQSYTVFRFGADMSISLYGNDIHLPAPIQGHKFCLIIDLCEANVGTLFFMLPPESRNILDNFDIFKTFTESGLRLKPNGIGISLHKNINVHSKLIDTQLWNGDNLFKYPVFPEANLWLLSDIQWNMNSKHFSLDVHGTAEVFGSMPNVSTLLTGVFVDEWNGIVQLTDFGFTPTLRFRLFNEDVVIALRDIVTASLNTYISLGGQTNRRCCGNGANPEGLFLSFMVDLDPFRNVPLLKHWIFDINVQIHAFLITDTEKQPSFKTNIDIYDDLVNFKEIINKFGKLMSDFLWDIKHRLSVQLTNLFERLEDVVNKVKDQLQSIMSGIVNGLPFSNIQTFLPTIWSIVEKEMEPLGQQLIDAFEYNAYVFKSNITDFVIRENRHIRENANQIISKLRSQLISAVQHFSGFGLKFSASVNLIKLGLGEMEIEVVYSANKLGQCAKYKDVNNLMKGEQSMMVVGKVAYTKRVCIFFHLERGGSLGLAASVSSQKFIAQLNVHASLLGLKVSADMFITEMYLKVYLEGNIWDVFFARITVTAPFGKGWGDLEFNVKGQLDVKSDGHNFGGSYRDGMMTLTTKVTQEANKRLTSAQETFTHLKHSLTYAQDKLSVAQAKVLSCNSYFDSAVRSMDRAKEELEKAKGPFKKAIEKLNKAQRNVDNLCRIRSCPGICVPGFRLAWCKGGWFGYPCVRKTSCMFRLPNVLCHIANGACRLLRGAAYIALEAAKIFVRVPMLALDVAKAAVSVAQFTVDKSRVVLNIAVGFLEVAKGGLELAKGALEAGKLALESVKLIVGAAMRVFNMIIKYGIKNIIDVRNCQFELELSTEDKNEFDVSCEVNAFHLGWKTIGFEFDFKHPIASMWRIAKTTVESLLDTIKHIFGRRKREISFGIMSRLHHVLREVKRDIGDHQSGMNESSRYMNESTFPSEDDLFLRNKFKNRIEYFEFHCNLFINIQFFLSNATMILFEMTNDSVHSLRNVQDFKNTIENIDMDIDTHNFTAESLGISLDYAIKDYNMTEEDVDDVLTDARNSMQNDTHLQQMANATQFAKELLDSQMSQADSIRIVDHWLNSLSNYSSGYFKKDECSGYHDCVIYSFSILHEIFGDDHVVNQNESKKTIDILEDEFQSLILNRSRSIEDSHTLSSDILEDLRILNKSNKFCAKAPTIRSLMQNVTVLSGSSVRLKCNTSGDPTPTIQWFHYDTEMTNETTTDILHLDNVTKVTEGIYKCKAENIVIRTSADIAVLTVKECQPGQYFNIQECYPCTIGSYQPDWNQITCIGCPGGYTTLRIQSNNISQCVDIDECSKPFPVCAQNCRNTNGSFICHCNSGYDIQSDGRTCKAKESSDKVVEVAAGIIGGITMLCVAVYAVWKVFKPTKNKVRPIPDISKKPVLRQTLFQKTHSGVNTLETPAK